MADIIPTSNSTSQLNIDQGINQPNSQKKSVVTVNDSNGNQFDIKKSEKQNNFITQKMSFSYSGSSNIENWYHNPNDTQANNDRSIENLHIGDNGHGAKSFKQALQDNYKDKDLEVTNKEATSRGFIEKLTIGASMLAGTVIGALSGALVGLAAGGIGVIPGAIAGAVIGATAYTPIAKLATGFSFGKLFEKPQEKHLEQAVKTLSNAGIKYSTNENENLNNMPGDETRRLLSIPRKRHKGIKQRQFTKEQRQMIRTAVTHKIASQDMPGAGAALAGKLKNELMEALQKGDLNEFKKIIKNEVSEKLANHYEEKGMFKPPEPAKIKAVDKVQSGSAQKQDIKSLSEAMDNDPNIGKGFEFKLDEFHTALNKRDYNNEHVRAAAYLTKHGFRSEAGIAVEGVVFLDKLMTASNMRLETDEDVSQFKERLQELLVWLGGAGGPQSTLNLSSGNRDKCCELLKNAQEMNELSNLQELQKELTEDKPKDGKKVALYGFKKVTNQLLTLVNTKMESVMKEINSAG